MSGTATLRRRASALALVGIPTTLLIGSLISPTDSTKNATQLHAAATHADRWQAAALLELLTAALFPLAVAGVARVVQRRGANLATVGAALGGLGALGMAAIATRHLFIYGLTVADQPSALRVLDQLDNHAGAIALPLMFAGPLALIAITAAAARARLVPSWLVAGAVLFFISDSLPIPAAEEVQGVIGIVTFGWIATRLLRLIDDDRQVAAGAADVTQTGTQLSARVATAPN
jgi:hypothetical protein